MKSPFTNKEMKLIIEKASLQFRREIFYYYNHAYFCEDTKEYITTDELDTLNINQVYNQYLSKHNIPFPEEIRSIRRRYELPVNKMSLVLGFGINVYRQYENGDIPSLSNAKLIHIAKNPNLFKEIIKDSTEVFTDKEKNELLKRVEDIIEEENSNYFKYFQKYILGEEVANRFTGYRTPNLEKFAEMVIFFAEKMKPLKTVMNKLLFYSDFSNYKHSGFSISGLRYCAIDRGPVPNNFQTIFEHLQKSSYVNIIYEDMGNGYVGERFEIKNGRTFNADLFSAEEIKTLQNIECNFKNIQRAVDIVNLSHEECAWKENFPNKDLIDYDYGFKLVHT